MKTFLGSNAGNYSTSSNSFVNVDATNLTYTVTIPANWVLVLTAWFSTGQGQAGLYQFLDSVVGAVGLQSGTTAADNISLSIGGTVAGDGMSHTITLQYVAGTAGTIYMLNTAGIVPVMMAMLTPTN